MPLPDAVGDNPDPRAVSTFVVGTVCVLLTVVVFIGLEVLYYKTAGAEFSRKKVETTSVELESTRAEQSQLLENYRWVDKDAGVVSMPIERAMELIVEEHAKP